MFYRRALWDEYIDGVLDFLGGRTAFFGTIGENGYSVRKGRELAAVRRQGWHDAKDRCVLERYEFDKETVLRRSDMRERKRAAKRAPS